ncbi:MAG TPA: P-loop NTPase fold protein [Vicinamibacterales bacterium]|jgi:KAP-like P-loop domain-containing protein|nr:P-loop NTPase fold protein [Vicinamibacterales bacterium]
MTNRPLVKPEWDSTLTYDDLETDATGGLSFVGRQELLDIIVGAIRHPDRRGTFLVSGYRGAGKTTMLIQAIRLSQKGLPAKWTLLPLVLNASEVSAALPPPSAPAGQPAASVSLQIGPQQLLTALIRTLRNYAESSPGQSLPANLRTRINDAYRKAIAKEYSRSEGTSAQQSRTVAREFELKLTTADAYKSLSAAGAAAAAVIEASAWVTSGLQAGLHAIAVATGALAVGSWTASRKISETAKQESTEAVSVKYDNSLQQLEGDLKDLLTTLHQQKQRVVVVLEELDKIKDEDGRQLDAVIRYFKNLFTQAPALFFFVTDKGYYDFIASEIRRARRDRSYAIQHTFFTHRLFVGRPTTRDCLDYVKSILADAKDGEQLDKLYATGGIEPFNAAIPNDPLLRFVRSILFKSNNHLFDLKNELRRFVRTDKDKLVLDTKALSDDDVAAGAFQDLIVQKQTLFAFGDGRPYANEVLNDCLAAVFTDLGSDATQQVNSYYPRGSLSSAPPPSAAAASGAAAAAPAPAPMPDTGDQLELSEQARIKAAVDSLIEDLQRGGAFEADRTNITRGQFVWKRTAARAFRFLRRLERHETELVARVDKLRVAIEALGNGGRLANLAGVRADADKLLQELDEIKKTVETTDRTFSVDETDFIGLDIQRRTLEPVARAYDAHLARVEVQYRLGTPWYPIGASIEGGKLFALNLRGGSNVTDSGPLGAVLLAFGEGGRMDDDAREFVAKAPRLQRLVILHVLHAPGDPSALSQRGAQWREQMADVVRQPTVDGRRRDVIVETMPLDEGWPENELEKSWGGRLTERMLLHATWAWFPTLPQRDGKKSAVLRAQLDQGDFVPFNEAVHDWVKSDSRVLHVIDEVDLDTFAQAFSEIGFSEVVCPPADPASALSLAENARFALDVSTNRPDPESIYPLVPLVNRLVARGEIVPYIYLWPSRVSSPPGSDDPAASERWASISGFIRDRGRAIVVASEKLEIPRDISKTTLRLGPSSSAAA